METRESKRIDKHIDRIEREIELAKACLSLEDFVEVLLVCVKARLSLHEAKSTYEYAKKMKTR